MARITTPRGLPYFEELEDPPNGATQQQDLAESADARMVTGEQAASLPPVPLARRLQFHTGTRTHWYSDGDAWHPVQGLPRRTVTASGTLVLADTNAAVDASSASPVTLTIPPQSAVGWLTATTVQVLQTGAGQVTIAPGAGVTIRSDGGRRATAGRYTAVTLQRLADDEWVLLDATNATWVRSSTDEGDGVVWPFEENMASLTVPSAGVYRVDVNIPLDGEGKWTLTLRNKTTETVIAELGRGTVTASNPDFASSSTVLNLPAAPIRLDGTTTGAGVLARNGMPYSRMTITPVQGF